MDPRDSADFIAKLSRNVFIHPEKIRSLTEHIYNAYENHEISLTTGSIKEHETFPDLNEQDAINLIFLLDTLNFCFWTKSTEQKWTVEFNGQSYTGYFGLSAAVAKAIKGGVKIYDPKVYSKFGLEDIKRIFKGDNGKDINLPDERLRVLLETSNVLLTKYDGQFINCVKQANKSAEKLLKLIVTDFPCFNDSALYNDEIVSFHKRAQILVGDVWTWNYGKGIGEFADIGYITMFADYRVPQALVYFGLMSYGSSLSKKLADEELLEYGSEEEIEIRGCSIKVIEMLVADLKEYMKDKKQYECNSIIIDNYLWAYRRKEADKMESIPYHKVYSIYY